MRMPEPAETEKNPSQSTLNEPEKDLVSWTAPARPFKRRDRQFYVTAFSIAGIVSLILFLAEGLMPVLLVISLVFLYYVLSTVEPEAIEYKVTNKGIKVAGRLTEWANFKRYWYSKRFDSELMIMETFGLPGRLEVVIKPDIKESLTKEMSAYIPYEEVPASTLDRLTNWFAGRLPGNH